MIMKNTNDCANDLFARMVLASKNKEGVTGQFFKRNIPKFKSSIVLEGMIRKNLIEGRTNQFAYELYKAVADELELPVLTQIDFTRTLCKYYGFTMENKKINGKKVRIFHLKQPTMGCNADAVLNAAYYINQELEQNDVIGCSNRNIYNKYLEWCRNNCQQMCSKIEFSRLICKILGVKIKNVKIKGEKFRIYALEEGAADGDNSSSQKDIG